MRDYLKRGLRAVLLGILLAVSYAGPAAAEKAVFTSPLVWRGDGKGDYLFEGQGKLKGTRITKAGSIEYLESPGVYEPDIPYLTKGTICGLTANWSFRGEVTMEASVTGDSKGYVPIVFVTRI